MLLENLKTNITNNNSLFSYFCGDNIAELDLYLKSIKQFLKSTDFFIFLDKKGFEKINEKYTSENNFHIIYEQSLDKYSDTNRKNLETKNLWKEFMLKKVDYTYNLLDIYKTVMYTDTDIIFLNDFAVELENYDVGLFPHYINISDEKKYGIYNAGAFITKSKDFCTEWKNISISYNGFYEQQALDYIPEKFKTKKFEMNYNFGWWRIFKTENQNETFDRMKKITLVENKIFYNDKPLYFIHTHFIKEEWKEIKLFNSFIKKLMKKTSIYQDYL